jgi:hypothetical protein
MIIVSDRLAPLPSVGRQRAQLALSIGFNLLSKIPGIFSAFLVLPIIKTSLGLDTYGHLLAAAALGSACGLPFGGIDITGRRTLGVAHAAGDQKAEADRFVTAMAVSAGAATLMALAAFSFQRLHGALLVFAIASAAAPAAAIFSTFDTVRAGYNEAYVSAIFRALSQSACIAAVIYLGLPPHQVLLCVLVLVCPGAIGSLGSAIQLLRARPYLRRGRIRRVKRFLHSALGYIITDSAQFTALNLSIFMISLHAAGAEIAWLGTLCRLFLSVLSPVVLVVLPLGSYITLRWAQLSPRRRGSLLFWFLLCGLAYGYAVAAAATLGGGFVLVHWFKIPNPWSARELLCLGLYFGALAANKVYAQLIFSIGDAWLFSYASGAIALLSTGTTLALMLTHAPPPAMVDRFCTLGAASLICLLVADYLRRARALAPKLQAA